MAVITVKTIIGVLIIQGDDQGLTGISLPGSPPKNIPGSRTDTGQSSLLHRAAAMVREYLAGGRTGFDLPLILAGTSFQLRTWHIIREIPYGRTMSYGEIASRLGNRNLARAVGGAAHANPLPLVIPCHRVIGSSGSLTGFGGGLALKEKLLRLEADRY